MNHLRTLAAVVFVSLTSITGTTVRAADFSINVEDDGVSVFIDGELFTKYITEGAGNKPYFWPVIGPTGKPMTRAWPMKDVEGERQDHVHHRSMWFGHQRINGIDTWHEPATWTKRFQNKPEELARRLENVGATLHRQVRKAEAGGDRALLVTESDYVDSDGKRLLQDVRRFVFKLDPDSGARIVDVELKLIGSEDTVTLDDAKDSGFSVRVAHTMSVDAGLGGAIVNSKGDRDRDAWGQRAKWCDFYGPVDGETLGIAILNHPSSFRYPTPWHARTYGLFTANPFGLKSVARLEKSGAVELKRGESISLKYRVIFHKGDASQAKIDKAFKAYAREQQSGSNQ